MGLTWYDKNNKRLGGGFKNSLLIDYEKSTPLVDGPNQRGFDESFITPNCPNTDPLYIYIENGMVAVPAGQRHKRENLPNPGGKWRWDNDEGWMSPGYGATKGGPRGDFVWELDVLVGRMLDLVKELGLDDNTLVLFNSDNDSPTSLPVKTGHSRKCKFPTGRNGCNHVIRPSPKCSRWSVIALLMSVSGISARSQSVTADRPWFWRFLQQAGWNKGILLKAGIPQQVGQQLSYERFD